MPLSLPLEHSGGPSDLLESSIVNVLAWLKVIMGFSMQNESDACASRLHSLLDRRATHRTELARRKRQIEIEALIQIWRSTAHSALLNLILSIHLTLSLISLPLSHPVARQATHLHFEILNFRGKKTDIRHVS